MARPAKAIINLANLRHNFDLADRLSGDGGAIAIVKANAYGHGAVPVARALESRVPAFGVASIEEALELRAAGIRKPVLLLEGFFQACELEQLQGRDFWLMLSNEWQIETLISATIQTPVKVFLKIDTGMHRLGITPERTRELFERLRSSNNVDPSVVLASHLASGDAEDGVFTAKQWQCFQNAAQGLEAEISFANSPGLLAHPEVRGRWNRPGFMLYGNSPFEFAHPEADRLKPVMTLESGINGLRDIPAGDSVGYGCTWVAERPSRIATVAIGYGDGYPRTARSGTPVLVNGQRVPLVGRVSMDMITVDVTDLDTVALGDRVELWGETLTANEVAHCAGSIGYEALTRMPLRTPRIYVE